MRTLLSFLGLCLVLSACKKSDGNKPTDGDFNCLVFKTALSIEDQNAIATEVNKLCTDLYPAMPTPADGYGQAQNINILVQRLSQKCDVTATLICYSCIKTYPSQSEIRVNFNLNGTSYSKVLDITFTPQNMLTYSNNHE